MLLVLFLLAQLLLLERLAQQLSWSVQLEQLQSRM
jgi:hypothetical protein